MGEDQPRQAPTRIDLGEEPDFALGNAHVLPSQLAVEIEGRRRELQPRVMRVLVALTKASPNVISRDRLVDQCWDGRIVGDDAINRCILALRHLADEFEPPPFEIETVPRVGHRLVQQPDELASRVSLQGISRTWLLGAAAVIIATLVAAVIALIFAGGRSHWPWDSRARVPRVLIVPSGRDPASAQMARELATSLGVLGQTQPAAMRFINASQASLRNADLVLQVGRTRDSAGVKANILFMDPEDGAILWTREFEATSQNSADLRQQVAFAAGRVLGCAVDAIGSQSRPKEQDLKLYLNSCAAVTDLPEDADRVAASLRGIVSRSPHFAGGWARLLELETDEAQDADEPQRGEVRTALQRDVAAARTYYPGLPEAYIAQYELTPAADFLRRSRILDTAVLRNPGNADLRVERAMFLQSVGRINAAVGDAHQAVKLDPLSPAARDAYILTLALANRMDAAWAELGETERSWPGASNLVMTRYRLDLRFGDPRQALQLLRSGAIDTPGAQIQEAFLEARVHRSEENVDRAIALGRNAMRFYPGAIDGYLQTLAEFGRTEELLTTLLNWRRMDLADLIAGVIFRPAFSDLRRDRRFMQAADHLGLLTYWRTTGQWPDFCVAPDLPYDCKTTASSSSLVRSAEFGPAHA